MAKSLYIGIDGKTQSGGTNNKIILTKLIISDTCGECGVTQADKYVLYAGGLPFDSDYYSNRVAVIDHDNLIKKIFNITSKIIWTTSR